MSTDYFQWPFHIVFYLLLEISLKGIMTDIILELKKNYWWNIMDNSSLLMNIACCVFQYRTSFLCFLTYTFYFHALQIYWLCKNLSAGFGRWSDQVSAFKECPSCQWEEARYRGNLANTMHETTAWSNDRFWLVRRWWLISYNSTATDSGPGCNANHRFILLHSI